MRDLAKDSRWLQRQEPNRDNHISVNFYRAYDWLNQAIRAESEVERLQKVYAITNESWKKQVEENAQLRKVADVARALVPCEMYQYTRYLFDMKHTLDEYDKAKEGQE